MQVHDAEMNHHVERYRGFCFRENRVLSRPLSGVGSRRGQEVQGGAQGFAS